MIPTHDRRADLAVLLETLAAVDVPAELRVEVVVIANCCSDGTQTFVGDLAGRFPFPLRCVCEMRLGASVARNRGLRETRAEWIAFLDDDERVAPGWLSAIARAIEGPGIDMLSGRVILKWEVPRPAWWSPDFDILLSDCDLGEEPIELSQELANGGNFAVRRAVADRIGGLNEALDRRGRQILSGAETEFLERAFRSGFRMLYVPAMLVEHTVRAERTTARYLSRCAYGNARSRVWWRPPLEKRRIIKALVLRPLRLPMLLVAGGFHRVRGMHSQAVRLRLQRAAIRGRFRGTLERIAAGSRGIGAPGAVDR